jgi:REP element-mobilizing transposase RayT
MKAKPTRDGYQRRLPHFQGRGGPLFVTFCTKDHFQLPENVRTAIPRHCLHDHETKIFLYCAIVMPDHVHMIYWPLLDDDDRPFPLEEVLNSVKGASAHAVNRVLGRKGTVWLAESFDHVLRSYENVVQKVDYVRHNPVRKGICSTPQAYPWLWVNREVGNWEE